MFAKDDSAAVLQAPIDSELFSLSFDCFRLGTSPVRPQVMLHRRGNTSCHQGPLPKDIDATTTSTTTTGTLTTRAATTITTTTTAQALQLSVTELSSDD